MAPDPEGRTETTEGEGRSGATTRPVLSQPETAGTRWLALLQALRSRPLLEQAALLAAVPALAHLAQLLVIMFGRLLYPVDIEWMEGGVLTMASRLQQGLPVYAPAEAGYVPFPYPFGYPLLLAGVGAIFGLDYALGRAVSIAFVCLAGALIAREVSLAQGSGRHRAALGLLAVGLAAAGFPTVDGWYDLVRVDSMAVALIVAAAALAARPCLRHRSTFIAAVCLALAASTKQTVAPFIVVIVLFSLWRHRKRGLWLAGLALLAFGSAFVAAELVTQGNYSFYTLTLMTGHRLDAARFWEGLVLLLEFAPYFPLLLLGACLLALRRRLRARSFLWGGLSVGAWVFGALGMTKDGAHVNSLLPAVWFTPAWLLMVYADWCKPPSGETMSAAWTWKAIIPLGAALHLLLLWYPAQNHLLPPAKWEQAAAVRSYIESLDGRVHATTLPFVAAKYGKGNQQMHLQALADLQWANMPYLDRYATFLNLSAPHYVIVAGGEVGVELIYQRFALVETLMEPRYDITTTVGWRVRPRWVFARRTWIPRTRRLFHFDGSLRGWKLKNFRVTPARVPKRPVIWGGSGKLLNSLHRSRGHEPVGHAISPRFEVDRPCLRLHIGGGKGNATRVELRVAGRVVRQASGFDSHVLRRVDWDVSEFQSELARLRVVDDSSEAWGYVSLDEVVLHAGCESRRSSRGARTE